MQYDSGWDVWGIYTCSTYFGWYHHPSSGAQTIVSTASDICHTVIAICRYRGRVGTGLSVLWVAYTTHSTLKPVCMTFSSVIMHNYVHQLIYIIDYKHSVRYK
jgi:hypothetical protein